VTASPDIRGKPACSRDDALAVLKSSRDAGHTAYFAGGCVRDMLLGIAPKDFDVATDAPPQRVRKLFPRTQAVGAVFGVVLVTHGRSIVEVATFRSDGTYLDGRHPSEVHFTTAEQDAQRRDFTMNGLFFDPLENRVIDYVGGQADLHARRLRAIGNPLARFGEDHLRLLRAVRFAARFAFDIEPATADALKSEAGKLKRISPERIADELRLMLTPTTRMAAWEFLWQYGLATEVFRHLSAAHATMPPAERSVFHQFQPATAVSFGAALTAVAVTYQFVDGDIRRLMEPAAVKATARALRVGLKISNVESDAVENTLIGLAPLLADSMPTLAMKKRFLARETASRSIELMRAFAAVGEQRERIARLEEQLAPLIGTEVAPLPLITGDDLTAMGLTPGPRFKRILDRTYDEQLEGRLVSKDQAEAFARGLD
jgi:poly(A) polymerase